MSDALGRYPGAFWDILRATRCAVGTGFETHDRAHLD